MQKKDKPFTEEEMNVILKRLENGEPLFEVVSSLPPYEAYLKTVGPKDRKLIEDYVKNFAEKLEPSIFNFKTQWDRNDVQVAFAEEAQRRYGAGTATEENDS